jgi:hypothetical protein
MDVRLLAWLCWQAASLPNQPSWLTSGLTKHADGFLFARADVIRTRCFSFGGKEFADVIQFIS